MTYASKSTEPPTPERMAAIAQLSQELAASGVLLMTGGLVRPSRGTQIKLAGDQYSVTDGPFAETKELIDGFALVHTASKQEAIALAERFMRVAGDGEGEILQVYDSMEIPH